MLKTPLCDVLGIEKPVFQGGMAWIADASLAAAVSEAGGLGIIAAMNADAEWLREQIHELRRAYRLLFADEGTLSERVEDVASEFASHPLIHEILDFIRSGGERAICVPHDVTAPDR